MGTRAVIQVEGLKGVYLYKHWDGYPSATLPWLMAFNRRFRAARGDDGAYCFAQLIRSSVTDCETYGLDPSTETGWGVVTSMDCGAELRYKLMVNGDVRTYQEYYNVDTGKPTWRKVADA